MLNLRLNYPSVPAEATLLQEYIQALGPGAQSDILHPPYQTLTPGDEAVVRRWLDADERSQVVPLPSANSGLYAVLSRYGGPKHIAVEPFTFPGFKMAASLTGYQLHTVAADGEGMLPEALNELLSRNEVRLLYLQPTIQNPTCATMSLTRREAIARIVRSYPDVYILEDDAYRFLHADPPPSFLTLLPERTIHLFSLSKTINPFLRSGYLLHPAGVAEGVENFLRITTSGTSRLFIAFGIHLMAGQGIHDIIAQKRDIGRDWHARCADTFRGLEYHMHPGSFHCWLAVPDPGALTRTLRERGIDVPDGAEFATGPDKSWVRIALGAVWDDPALPAALQTIADLTRAQHP
ncbi:hypothetical protein ACWKWU_18555 [Chitinophaga lutea]